jgi:hypothetical protein
LLAPREIEITRGAKVAQLTILSNTQMTIQIRKVINWVVVIGRKLVLLYHRALALIGSDGIDDIQSCVYLLIL